MPSLKSIKPLLAFVLLGIVGAWMGCSDSAPVASRPAGKATCSLCEFLGDDTYTATDGLPAPENPDTTQTDADADSTQAATVEFADANLERCMREALDRPAGPLTPADLAALTELDASYKNIESVAGLQHATALDTLELNNNSIASVDSLRRLTNMTRMTLRNNQIVSVDSLKHLTNMTLLDLQNNQITDASPLIPIAEAQGLSLWIYLTNNPLSQASKTTHIPAMQAVGTTVQYSP